MSGIGQCTMWLHYKLSPDDIDIPLIHPNTDILHMNVTPGVTISPHPTIYSDG